METYSTQITDYLLTQSWQIAMLVVAVAAATWLLRNKSAHVRYLLWLIVLAKCLVPPLVTIPLAVLPREKPIPMLQFQAPPRMVAEPATSRPAPQVSTPATAVVPPRTRLNMRQRLAIAWIAGLSVFVVVAIVKALQTICWLRWERKPLPVALHSTIESLFRDFGTLPKLWLVAGIGQPFVWGFLRGSIYLPADFVKVNDVEYRRGILGHELCHILRFDAAVNCLQVIAQAVFWFHPFVWWANKRIWAEREKCCDEMAVARLGAKAKDYSRAIVNILISEQESTRPVPSLAVAGPVKNIEERIETMLRPGKKFYKHPSLIAVTVVLVGAVLIVPTAFVLTARAQETKTASQSEEKPSKSLHQAAWDGDVEQIKLNVRAGAHINSLDSDWGSALHYAAMEGHAPVVEVLISEGADINVRDIFRRSPLDLAVMWEHPDIVKLLITKGADVNVKDKWAYTPLHRASFRGNRELVEPLISGGADVNAKNSWGWTPIYGAMTVPESNREFVEFLIRAGAKVPALHLAAYRGNLQEVTRLVNEGTDVHARNDFAGTALHTAVAGGNKQVAAFLTSRGADVNAKCGHGQTPLHVAANLGHTDIAELLIAEGSHVNAKAYQDFTPLHYAGNKQVAELLIAKGADINMRTTCGATPLNSAASGGRTDVAELLITKGLDVNVKSGSSWMPLHRTVWHRHKEMAEFLIAKGADINAKGPFGGETPLILAIGRGDQGLVELLIAKGADLNAKGKSGRTPLHEAAMKGRTDIAELLVASGADMNIKDNEGKTTLSLAKERQRTEIVELLRKHGAKE